MYSDKYPQAYAALLSHGMKGSDEIRLSLPFVNAVRLELGLPEAVGSDQIADTLAEIEDAINGKTE